MGGAGGMPGGLGVDLQGAQFSIINSLRTGNMVVDMLLAMAVPYLFRMLMNAAQRTGQEGDGPWHTVRRLFLPPYYTREIEHRMIQTTWLSSPAPPRPSSRGIPSASA